MLPRDNVPVVQVPIAVGAVSSVDTLDIVWAAPVLNPIESVVIHISSPGAGVLDETQTLALESVRVALAMYRKIPRYSLSPVLASAALTSSKRLFIVASVIVTVDLSPPRESDGVLFADPPEKQKYSSLAAIAIFNHLCFSHINHFG
jgi:hypothetical protein